MTLLLSLCREANVASRDVPLDLVLVATGILHRGKSIQPEKSMRELDAQSMAEVLAINSTSPSLVAKHFLPTLRRDRGCGRVASGTVATQLSKPFTGRVPAGQLFTPDQSASKLLGVIDDLSPGQTGGFFAYDGSKVEF